jgi:UDP-3-O-[3-hydroxymyristoyl] glucosamine N-acyltransferase
MQLVARDIASLVDGELAGNPDEPVTGVAAIKEAQPGDVTFVANPRYLSAIKTTLASVIIVAKNSVVNSPRTLVRVDNPSLAFAKVVEHSAPPAVKFKPGVHPSACISPTAQLGCDVSIQPFAVIEDGAIIGDRSVIGAGSYVGYESRVGADCLLYPRVVLRERTRLGNRVTLHAGVVLGADGFGYEPVEGHYEKIAQVGVVEIGDDVEIGANSAIDRARFGSTRIGRGTKIDNLVQIGHNCVIGEDCIICAQAGLAGSTRVGDRVTIAGQVGVAGHLEIGKGALIMAQAGIMKNVPEGARLVGSPAVLPAQYMRSYAVFLNLSEMAARLRAVEEQLAALRARPQPDSHA